MINIRSNGSKWAGESPDPLDVLFANLANHPLDRMHFRGSFWSKERDGITNFFGNFLTLSAVFNIDTDEPALIDRIKSAIRANWQRPDYRNQPELEPVAGGDWLA